MGNVLSFIPKAPMAGNQMEIRINCKYFVYSFCANAITFCTRWWVFGCETSPYIGDPYSMLSCLKTPPLHEYQVTNRSKSGTPFRKLSPKSSRTHLKHLLRLIPTHVTDYSHWLRGWDSRDHLLENGPGVDLVFWSFKYGRDEPEYSFGKIAYTCDSGVLTYALQIATEDVTRGRSTHSATSKRTCVDGDVRQFH